MGSELKKKRPDLFLRGQDGIAGSSKMGGHNYVLYQLN